MDRNINEILEDLKKTNLKWSNYLDYPKYMNKKWFKHFLCMKGYLKDSIRELEREIHKLK